MAEVVRTIRIEVKGNQLATARKDVDLLTKELRDLRKATKNGTVATNEQRRRMAELSVNLKAARNNYRDLEASTLKANNALRKNSGFVAGIKKGMAGFAKQALAAGAAMFALSRAIQVITKISDINKAFGLQMAKVKGIVAETNEEFILLQKSALDLGRKTQFTATQVGQLQEEFGKLGLTTPEIIAAQDATLDLAVAVGTDLANAATIVAGTLKAYEEDASEAGRLTNIMADAFTSTALDIEKFKVGMSTVGPVAKNAGASIEQTTALLGVLADRNVDASTAGTSLRNIFLTIAKEGITLDQALNKIQASSNKNATAMELFGKRGATVATILAANQEEAKKLTNQLIIQEGEAKKLADTIGDTFAGAVLRLNSAMEGAALLFQQSDGSVKILIDDIADAVNKFTDFAEEVDLVNKVVWYYRQGLKIATAPLRGVIELGKIWYNGLVAIGTFIRDSLISKLNTLISTYNLIAGTFGLAEVELVKLNKEIEANTEITKENIKKKKESTEASEDNTDAIDDEASAVRKLTDAEKKLIKERSIAFRQKEESEKLSKFLEKDKGLQKEKDVKISIDEDGDPEILDMIDNEAAYLLDAYSKEEQALMMSLDRKEISQIEYYDKLKELRKKDVDLELDLQMQKFAAVASTLNSLSELAKEGSISQKALAISAATLNTYVGVTGALAASAPPPLGVGPIVAQIQAVSILASGLASVAKISGLQFAEGGIVPAGNIATQPNGDNVAATLKTGEVVLNSHQQALLGGQSTFKRIGVPGFANGGQVGGASIPASVESAGINQAQRNIKVIQVQSEFEEAQADFEVANTQGDF